MNALKTFLDGQDLPASHWAAVFGVSRSYLSQMAAGLKAPSLDLAFRIERATGGAVPAASWVVVPADGPGGDAVSCPDTTPGAATSEGNKVSSARGAA